MDSAVCCGVSTMSSSPESGDFPTIVDAFKNEAEDDRRDGDAREGDAREGDRDGVGPPIPWSEFIEAFRWRDGEDERVSMLMELGLRRRGLRGDALPFGEEEEVARCARLRAGEADFGDAESAVDEAASIVSRFRECAFGFEGGKGACSIDCLTSPYGDV